MVYRSSCYGKHQPQNLSFTRKETVSLPTNLKPEIVQCTGFSIYEELHHMKTKLYETGVVQTQNLKIHLKSALLETLNLTEVVP